MAEQAQEAELSFSQRLRASDQDLRTSEFAPSPSTSAQPLSPPFAAASAAAESIRPGALLDYEKDSLLEPPPQAPEIPEMPAPVTSLPSQRVLPEIVPPNPVTVAMETDERFVSLRRSYGERLVSMASIFRELPQRLTEDGPLTSLRMCEADPEDLRERAFEIFQEALQSSQEQIISALQQKLSEQEVETAKLGRQLGTMLSEQREFSDVNGIKFKAAEKELVSARARLEELEEYYRKSSTRQAALEERARTIEEETIYWRSRGAPLRERCEQLEQENVALRSEREAMRLIVETSKRVQQESESEVISMRAAMEGANLAAAEARKQAQQATADAEGRWLHQGLSIVLSRIFEVVPVGEDVQQGLYAASTGEEFTKAGGAFVEVITTRFQGLESELATSQRSLQEATETLSNNEEELIKARTTASMSSQHAHEMVERTLAAERERKELDLLKATREERERREAAEAERDVLRDANRAAADEQSKALAKAKIQHEAALDERSQQFSKDMRALTASFRDARAELAAQADQLKEARRQKADAERALYSGLDEAYQRVEASEAKQREQAYLTAQLAGHASTALQQELLSIFGARDLLSTAAAQSRARSAASVGASLPYAGTYSSPMPGANSIALSPAGAMSLATTGASCAELRHSTVKADTDDALSAVTLAATRSAEGESNRGEQEHAGLSVYGSGVTIAGGVPSARRPPIPSPSW
jgi:hypothetical protein